MSGLSASFIMLPHYAGSALKVMAMKALEVI